MKMKIRLADRLGLMVWSEIPVYWDIDWSNPATLASAEAQLRDEIARDHNRAAVILWSVERNASETGAPDISDAACQRCART